MNIKDEHQKRKICLKAYVTENEYGQIIDLSEQCGLSISELTRRVLIGQDVYSKVDSQIFLEVLKVNGDLGRLGGLLKLWLTDSEKSKGYTRNVRKILNDIGTRQQEMKPLISKLESSIRKRKF